MRLPRVHAWELLVPFWGFTALDGAVNTFLGSGSDQVQGAALAVVSGAALWVNIAECARARRSGMAGARSALLRAARAARGQSELWLDRDQHVLLSAVRSGPWWARQWHVLRFDEDAAAEASQAGPGERVAITCEVTQVAALLPRVMRFPDGIAATAGQDGEFTLAPEDARRGRHARSLAGAWRMARSGVLWASAGEVSELAAQLSAAEPIATGAAE